MTVATDVHLEVTELSGTIGAEIRGVDLRHQLDDETVAAIRSVWLEGDVGFWDNRVTQHAVVGDYGDQHRVIQRVTLRGTEPV